MASGVIAFTLVTLVTIRSLIGKGSWMKLKPLYAYVSPLAVSLATLHVVMMGYNYMVKLRKRFLAADLNKLTLQMKEIFNGKTLYTL